MRSMSSHAVLAAALLSGVALAAPPKSGIGSAKEEAACPQPGLGGADLALLRATRWAVEPAPLEVRVIAIEDLGLLGDPRALNFAAQFALDPNPRMAGAAVRAVSLLRHPRATEILRNVVRHPSVADAVRVLALRQLVFQNSWAAIRFVRQCTTDTTLPSPVVSAARQLAAQLPALPSPMPGAGAAPQAPGAPR